MALERYSGYAASMNATAFRQIIDVGVDLAAVKGELIPSGSVDRLAVATAYADPRASLSTNDLTTALALNTAAFATAGLSCTSGAVIQFQKRITAGTFSASSDHLSLTSTAGFWYPTSLSCDIDSQTGAVLETIYVPYSSDGLTSPWAYDETSALSSSPAYTSHFFLGPVKFNTTTITSLQSLRIDFGLNVATKRHGSGGVFPEVCSIITRTPRVEMTFSDLAAQANLSSLFGNAASGAGVTIFLRKGVHGGTRVADGTTAHIKLVAATGDLQSDGFSARGNDDGSTTIAFLPTTTFTVTVGSAIS